jgi:hypothetical protein
MDTAAGVTCGDLVPSWQIPIFFNENDTVIDALEVCNIAIDIDAKILIFHIFRGGPHIIKTSPQRLREANISSAPVISSDGIGCFGMIDALDIVSFMVKLVLADKDSGELTAVRLRRGCLLASCPD